MSRMSDSNRQGDTFIEKLIKIDVCLTQSLETLCQRHTGREKKRNMKEILIEIDKAAKGELERANEKYPLFHSDHEGISVIFEEIDEVNFNLAQSEDYRGKAWEAIKQDDTANAAENIALMRMQLCYAAAEMIQVIAMCEKFIKSQEARRCQQK